MALQHLRSSTANKRPTPAAMAEGQLAMNTEATSPGLFFKNASGTLVKVGPVHVGTTAPNASPASGGETGNTVGEQWLDTTGGTYNLKIWDGTAWRSEAGEFVNVTGDTMTGALVMDNQQQVRFRETTANGTNYIAIQAPASVASDKTLTLPDATGTLVSTGDSGTVTSTMIADGTIVNADISASAAIDKTKISGTAITAGDTGTVTSTMIADGTILNADINASAAIAGTKISPDFGSQNVTTTGNITVNAQGDLRFGDSDSSNWVAFQAPGTVASNVTWTLPSADGTSDQVLKTDGAGTLSWGTAAGDKISEGNTEAEVVDTGTDGHFKVTTEGTERLRIDKDGNLLKGLTTARSNFIAAPGTIPTFQIEGTGNAAIGSITYYGNDTSGPAWGLAKSRGTTAGSSTTVVTGDSTGDIYFFGANGTTLQPTAQIGSVVDTAGTVSSTSMPGALVFYTTPTGTNIPTQRLRISESGSIGIGVTPKSSANSSVSTLEIGRNTLRGGQTSFSIYQNGYWDASTGFDKRIFTGSATQYYQDTYFSWSTSGSGAADSTISFTERMRLDSNGNVGIGTNSPANYANFVTLALADTSGAEIDFLKGSTIQGSIYNAGDIFYLESKSTVPTAFVTNGSERMRLDSSGRLGLGTSSPSFAAHISAAKNTSQLFVGITGLSSADDYAQLGFGSGSTPYGLVRLGFDNPAGVTNTYLSFYNNNGSSNVERLRIDSSGRVGIGTTAPSANLQVGAGSGLQQTLISGGGYDLYLGASGGTLFGQASQAASVIFNTASVPLGIGTNAAQPLILGTNAQERARIDSSGRLLVGTSSAGGTELIQIQGASTSSTAPGSIALRRSSLGNTDDIGYINFTNASGNAHAQIKAFCDGTPAANDYPGALVFSTTADGASSPTERVRIQNNGATKLTTTGSFYGANSNYHESRNGYVNNVVHLFNHNASSGSIYGIQITYDQQSKSSSTADEYIYCNDSGAVRMTVRGNGGIANYSGNNVNLCDEREKKNIVNLDSTWDCLKHWELKKFHYNEDANTDDLRYGVIAQQVADYCPEVISEWIKQKAEPAKLDEEGNEIEPAKEEVVRMAVKEQQMMWMAIKALQEAQIRIEELEAKVAALEAS